MLTDLFVHFNVFYMSRYWSLVSTSSGVPGSRVLGKELEVTRSSISLPRFVYNF